MSSTYDSSDSISPTFLGLLQGFLLSNDATSLPLGMGPISLRNVGAAYANGTQSFWLSWAAWRGALIRIGPEDNSQFSRTILHNGGPSKSSLSTNNAFDFNAEFVITLRALSFPSSLGFRLAWTQIGPPLAPHRPTVIPLRIGGLAAAVVFPSRSLLAALPCFAFPPQLQRRPSSPDSTLQ